MMIPQLPMLEPVLGGFLTQWGWIEGHSVVSCRLCRLYPGGNTVLPSVDITKGHQIHHRRLYRTTTPRLATKT